MLAGVLLHVVATAAGIDLAVDAGSGLQVPYRLEVVDDPSIFSISDFGDAQLVGGILREDGTGIKDLAPARWIESSAVENDCRSWVLSCLADFRIEIIEKRIVIVEALGHT